MTEQESSRADRGADRRFLWHPTYQGKAVAQVIAEIEGALRADQRSYQLTIEGPEEHEDAMLARIVELERRWGPYAMDWYSADARALAERIASFEWEREQRRELFPYAEYREQVAPIPIAITGDENEEEAEPSRPWWKFW